MGDAVDSKATWHIGNHVVVVEDGICQVVFSGRVDTQQAVEFQRVVLEAGDRFGLLGCIVDLGGLSDFDTGARAQFIRVERPYPFFSVSYYGGSFAARMLVTTLMRAGKLLVPWAFTFSVHVVPTEEEARQLVRSLQTKHASA